MTQHPMNGPDFSNTMSAHFQRIADASRAAAEPLKAWVEKVASRAGKR